jgi:hypothetical protein
MRALSRFFRLSAVKHLNWRGLGLTMFAMILSVNLAKADVISFSGVPADGSAFTTYTEGSFTVVSTTGSWFTSSFGNPSPSIFDGPIGGPGLATIKVTGVANFTWASVDYASNNGPSSYNIQGFLGGVSQFDEIGTLVADGPPFGFTTLTGTDSSKVIDTLFITVNPNIAGVPPPTSINLDNIVVTTPRSAPTVPEPESFVLIGTGLVGLVRFRRFWLR